jgi:two-component system chemotaxis response regulator CheB
LGQDEHSSLIYGMPRVAFECGAVAKQYPLEQLAHAIMDVCEPEAAPGELASHSHDAA